MLSFLPRQISMRAIIVYLLALALVSLAFPAYAMNIGFILMGCVWVIGFFMATEFSTTNWRNRPEKYYIQHLFILALALRLIWVVFSYLYYIQLTGAPFEFDAADSVAYHSDAEWLAGQKWTTISGYLFSDRRMISDSGYLLYLTIIYKLFGGPFIIPTRIIKALLSSFTCVLVYKLAARTFDNRVARMAGLMMALMPNLIIYCGFHLKETEMLFLEVACLERIDYLFRSREFRFWNLLIPTLLAGSLFLFRTVLGAAAIFAFATGALLSSAPNLKKNMRRLAIIGWGVLSLVVMSGGTIATEVEGYWEVRDDNVTQKRLQQTIRGNQWAKYATGAVMAPMIVVLPFATMVDVDEQYGQQEKSGGNFIRNFMGFFAVLAIYEALRQKKWKDFIVIGAFVIAYLGVIATSGYSNSERFLLPALPGLICMWAYGLSELRAKSYRLLTPWCILVFLMEFGWAFFKLGSRGLF